MSLENQIATLTEKLEKLTEVTEALMNLRVDAIETVKKTADSTKSTSTSKKADEKKEETKEEGSSDDQKDSPDTLTEAIQEYTGMAGDDAAKRKEFIGNVKTIFGKVKAAKRSEVPAEKEAAVEKAVRKLIEAAKAAEEEGGDDDDLL